MNLTLIFLAKNRDILVLFILSEISLIERFIHKLHLFSLIEEHL